MKALEMKNRAIALASGLAMVLGLVNYKPKQGAEISVTTDGNSRETRQTIQNRNWRTSGLNFQNMKFWTDGTSWPRRSFPSRVLAILWL